MGPCFGLSSNAGEAGDCGLVQGSSYYRAWLGTWPHQAASLEQGAEKSRLQWGSSHQLTLCRECGESPLFGFGTSLSFPVISSKRGREAIAVSMSGSGGGQIGVCPL